MECIRDVSSNGKSEADTGSVVGSKMECNIDCRGQIVISVGVGIFFGGVLVSAVRWGLRYMVVDIGNHYGCTGYGPKT